MNQILSIQSISEDNESYSAVRHYNVNLIWEIKIDNRFYSYR